MRIEAKQHIAKVARINLPFDNRTRMKPANTFRKRGQPMMEFWLIFCLFLQPKAWVAIPPLWYRCGEAVYINKKRPCVSFFFSTAIVQRFYMWLDEHICFIHLTFPFNDPRRRERRGGLFSFSLKQKNVRAEKKHKYPRHLVWLLVPWRKDKYLWKMHEKRRGNLNCPTTWHEYVVGFFSLWLRAE